MLLFIPTVQRQTNDGPAGSTRPFGDPENYGHSALLVIMSIVIPPPVCDVIGSVHERGQARVPTPWLGAEYPGRDVLGVLAVRPKCPGAPLYEASLDSVIAGALGFDGAVCQRTAAFATWMT